MTLACNLAHLMDIQVNHQGLLHSTPARPAQQPERKRPVIIDAPAAACIVAGMVHAAPQVNAPAMLQRQAKSLQRARPGGRSQLDDCTIASTTLSPDLV